MESIGLHEAKTHLSEVVAKVCEGAEYTITRRGVPVAFLTPVPPRSQAKIRQAVEGLERLRKECRLDGLSVREMIEEGRRR